MKFDTVRSPMQLKGFIHQTPHLFMECEHANYFISYKRQILIHIKDHELTYVNEFFTHRHKEVKGIINGVLNTVTDYFIKFETRVIYY